MSTLSDLLATESDPTLGTLTKTFTTGEASTINLTSSVLAPVVSVTKEVPQSGVTNNNWDVSSTTENYTRLDSAYATTLDWDRFAISSLSFIDSYPFLGTSDGSYGMTFSPNGLNLFMTSYINNNVYQYNLSTAFDLSTASLLRTLSVSARSSSTADIAFNTDGTKMFIVDYNGDDVDEYTLSTGFDISTASYVDSLSISAQSTVPIGIAFNTDGTKMFIGDISGTRILYYSLSTGFDISTSSFVSSFSVSSQITTVATVRFNTDGTKMFVLDVTTDAIYQYTLSTGFDISTASFSGISFSTSGQDSSPGVFSFNSDGSKLFLFGTASDSINEYSAIGNLQLGTGSFSSADVGKTIEANDGAFVLTAADGSYGETTAPSSYDQVASGSWEMYGVVYNAAGGDLQLSGGLFNAFDISAAVYSQSFSVSGQEATPNGLAFNTNGTKMFVCGLTGADVNEYALSTGFDVSTAVYSQNFLVASQETQPQDVAFNTDGTKMFIVGSSGDDVNEYDLSTGFDVSTSVYLQNFSVSAQDALPSGLAFNNDGTKMFVIGNSSFDSDDSVYEYALTTGFNVSTASYSQAFSIRARDNNATAIAFNPTGTKMFIAGYENDNIYEYDLSTGFDVSTASFTASFSVASQELNPHGLAFNAVGSKMFIVGYSSDAVFEYDLDAGAYAYAFPTGYQPVHTTTSIDSTYWTDINSMTADQNAGSGEVYYAISTDGRTTWTVIDNTDGERDIVRNNAGTWQYNSNGTYASETWVNGATNTELATLAEAMEGAIGIPYNLSIASYDSISFPVTSQETSPRGVAFNTAGTKMFVVGQTSNTVFEYSLSTAFNVSTASYSSVSFSVSAQATSPQDLVFNPSGIKLFILFTNRIYQYSLSTAFDISTASYDSVVFSVSGQGSGMVAMAFNPLGTKMFLSGFAGGGFVYQYTLSSGFDLSTASYDSVSFSITSQSGNPQGLAFSPDGTVMLVTSVANADVYEYSLSTGFDLATASYDSISFTSNQETTILGMVISTDGDKMYLFGAGSTIYQYSIGSTGYLNQMDKTQLDAVTDPNHIALGNDLDLAIVFNMTSGTTVPSSDGVAINYDANVLNEGAVQGTDYDFDAPAGDKARITALASNNLKVRVV